MAIFYKINILKALKSKGYSTKRLREEKILAEGTIQALRENRNINLPTLNKVCTILEMQPGDIIGFKLEQNENIKL